MDILFVWHVIDWGDGRQYSVREQKTEQQMREDRFLLCFSKLLHMI